MDSSGKKKESFCFWNKKITKFEALSTFSDTNDNYGTSNCTSLCLIHSGCDADPVRLRCGSGADPVRTRTSVNFTYQVNFSQMLHAMDFYELKKLQTYSGMIENDRSTQLSFIAKNNTIWIFKTQKTT